MSEYYALCPWDDAVAIDLCADGTCPYSDDSEACDERPCSFRPKKPKQPR